MSPPLAARGFSLLELLMTVTLAALVLTLGLPSFGNLVADKRLRAETDALFHAVHLARKASIVRRRVVSLCPSSDRRSCDHGTDWSNGWILFADADRDEPPQVDEGEDVLMVHAVDERVRIDANRRAFTLRSTELRATNGFRSTRTARYSRCAPPNCGPRTAPWSSATGPGAPSRVR